MADNKFQADPTDAHNAHAMARGRALWNDKRRRGNVNKTPVDDFNADNLTNPTVTSTK